jgi:hypothetical protein
LDGWRAWWADMVKQSLLMRWMKGRVGVRVGTHGCYWGAVSGWGVCAGWRAGIARLLPQARARRVTTERSYRDRKAVAIEAPARLMAKYPRANVVVEDLQSGEGTAVVTKSTSGCADVRAADHGTPPPDSQKPLIYSSAQPLPTPSPPPQSDTPATRPESEPTPLPATVR